MNFFKAKLSTSIFAYGFVVGGLLGALLYYVFPNLYPNWYVEALVFFLILEPLIILIVEHYSRVSTQRQLLNVYLMTKVIKIFSSLIFIGIYALVIKEGIKNFVLTFMILYLLFLAMETILFLKIEKRLKENKQ